MEVSNREHSQLNAPSRRPNKLRLLIGIVLFVLGSVGVYTLFYYDIDGIFKGVTFHSPTTPFKSMNCPGYARLNESIAVSVTIRNPSSARTTYHIGFGSSDMKVEPANRFSITLPGNEEMELHWTVSSNATGSEWISMSAITDEDLALPGPYHFWPTSFNSYCHFLVVPGPVPGQWLPWLSWGSLSAGVVLILSVVAGHIRKKIRAGS